ncbi:MAG: amino acid adenylation domain-containing protein [Pseudomonadota bacterium]|nr:amino acid adenylation domain-containing protein [Pseudomonadota bacterium]
MLGADELSAQLIRGNQTEGAYPRESTVAQLFSRQASLSPEATALVCGERCLSYRSLDEASNRLAHDLRRRGVGLGQTVAVCLDRTPDLVVSLLAILKAGGHYVPLDPGYPPARLAQILEDAKPAALLTMSALQQRVAVSAPVTVLLDQDAELIGGQSKDALISNAGPDDVAYVLFTSGSTGRPKGVQIQHRALINLLWAMRERPGLQATDTLLAVTTVSFDIAALEIFLPLIVGAKLVMAATTDTTDGHALRSLIERHQVTVMQATPVTWQLLLAAGWSAKPSPCKMKMLCGGEALSRSLADSLLATGGELWNLYGPTETTIWSSALRVMPGEGLVPIGSPIANTQFHVLDAHAHCVPDGVPGELYIGGDGVGLGYLNRPDETEQRFVMHRFNADRIVRLYRTGDRVRTRADGGLDFLGRADGQIKLRGFRIELGEIEAVLRAQSGVVDCVAIVAKDSTGESAILAYAVIGEPGEEGVVERLRISLRSALPAYMCPSSMTLLEALPRTPNGKIDRAALPTPSTHVAADAVESALLLLPDSDPRPGLTSIWSSILGIPEPKVDDNFFEIGGHSLLAVRLLVRIEAEFGRQLSLATLFRNPTIAEQAVLLVDAPRNGEARAFDFRQVLKLQPDGSRQPLIAINNTGIYYALSKRLGPDQPFTSLQLFDPSQRQGDLPQTLEGIAAGYAELIRRVQPIGPYALIGWCVAGTLAFETARQLTMDDHRVSQLVLFDTMAPGHLQRLPWWRAVLAEYAYRWKLILIDWRRAKLGAQSMTKFMSNRTHVKKLMRAFGWPVMLDTAPPPLEPEHPAPLSPEKYDQWLLQYLEDAAASYVPKLYSGPMTLVRSSQEPAGRFLDPQMGWGDFVEDGIDVVVVEGDHFSIFREPRVSKLAEQVRATMASEVKRGLPTGTPRGSARVNQLSPSRRPNGDRASGVNP